MSKFLLAALLAALTYTLSGCGQMLPLTPTAPSQSLGARNVAQQELLVKFKSVINAHSIQTFHAQHGTRTLRVIPGLNVHVMVVTQNRPLNQVLSQITQNPMVEYAEINRPVTLSDRRF